jgi:hypothetical protein
MNKPKYRLSLTAKHGNLTAHNFAKKCMSLTLSTMIAARQMFERASRKILAVVKKKHAELETQNRIGLCAKGSKHWRWPSRGITLGRRRRRSKSKLTIPERASAASASLEGRLKENNRRGGGGGKARNTWTGTMSTAHNSTRKLSSIRQRVLELEKEGDFSVAAAQMVFGEADAAAGTATSDGATVAKILKP